MNALRKLKKKKATPKEVAKTEKQILDEQIQEFKARADYVEWRTHPKEAETCAVTGDSHEEVGLLLFHNTQYPHGLWVRPDAMLLLHNGATVAEAKVKIQMNSPRRKHGKRNTQAMSAAKDDDRPTQTAKGGSRLRRLKKGKR